MKSAEVISMFEMAGYQMEYDEYDIATIYRIAKGEAIDPKYVVSFWQLNKLVVIGVGLTRYKALQDAWRWYVNGGTKRKRARNGGV